MKILFFGTPDISTRFLRDLLQTDEVVGAVTQPDRPAERGYHVHPTPVKRLAAEHGIPVFQPVRFDEAVEPQLKGLGAEVGVVVSYGRLIPERVFTLPFYGCFNIHFSLLPKYRGAAPIQWTLIRGEEETGVTAFWIEKTLDSGPILVQKALPILPEDDACSLTGRLIDLGIAAMRETIARLKSGDCTGRPQKGIPTFAPCLRKEDGRIRWTAPARDTVNLIRGTKPWPGAHCEYPDEKGARKHLKVLKARVLAGFDPQGENFSPGQVAGLVKNAGFVVRCGEGFLLVEEVHPENRKAMSAWSFLQGGHLRVGASLP